MTDAVILNEKEVMKNECCDHAIFFNIFKFSTRKNTLSPIQWKNLTEQSNNSPKIYSDKKILKADGTTSIDYGVKLIIFFTNASKSVKMSRWPPMRIDVAPSIFIIF